MECHDVSFCKKVKIMVWAGWRGPGSKKLLNTYIDDRIDMMMSLHTVTLVLFESDRPGDYETHVEQKAWDACGIHCFQQQAMDLI